MGKRLLYQAFLLKCRQCLCLGVLRKHVFTGRVTPSGCAILDAPSPAHSTHLDGCSGLPLVHDTFLGECPAQKSRETNTWEIPLTSGKDGAHGSMPRLQAEVPGTLLRKSRWNWSTLPTMVTLTIHPYVGPPSEGHTSNYLLAPMSFRVFYWGESTLMQVSRNFLR